MRTVNRYCFSCGAPFEFKASWVHRPNAGRYCSVACRSEAQKAPSAPSDVRRQIADSVECDPNSGCWLWYRASCQDGYGSLKRKGFSTRAHRASWEAHRGPIPAGLHVLHKCDTPSCVNPEHLHVGTHAENMADMAAKGRGRSVVVAGFEHHCAKLSAEMVSEIVRSHASGGGGVSRYLAAGYGVSPSTIRRHIRAAKANSGPVK